MSTLWSMQCLLCLGSLFWREGGQRVPFNSAHFWRKISFKGGWECTPFGPFKGLLINFK